MNITFKQKHHAFIVSLLPNKSESAVLNYILAVRQQMNEPYSADTEITVSVSEDLVVRIYQILGSQQERYSASDNAEMKTALVPQIMENPELLARIMAIAEENGRQTELIRQGGIDYLMSITI